MLSSSEFNNAVPKFTNGNYANNPIDPQYIEEPTLQDYNRGVEPLETLPAQWWNWLCNQFTSRFNKINTYVKNIFDEITQLLSLLNITPDGTESAITTGQLKNFFKELYPSYVSDKLSLGTTYVPQTRTVNGHALSSNVTVTKSDVGLGSVANTGDSANVSNGGTTKFTTGGAYNILTSIAPIFSTSTAYSVGELVTYLNKFYECTTAHSAGAWNSSHFTARSISYVISNYILPSFAPKFSTSTSYKLGDFVIYQNKLYKCTVTHSAGAWNSSHFSLANLNDINNNINKRRTIRVGELYASNDYYKITSIGYYGRPIDFNVISTKGGYIRLAFGQEVISEIINLGNNIFSKFKYIPPASNGSSGTLLIKSVASDLSLTFFYTAVYDSISNKNISIESSTQEEFETGTDFNVVNINDKADLSDLATIFSTSITYAVGDYTIYNGDLYRCTVAHSAGTWDSSHFTLVTVGGELTNKADNSSLAVPSDAVVHYSFDEIPDYPDGTADVRLLDNNTYDIQSTNAKFRNNGGTTFTNDNGNLVVSITGGDSSGAGIDGSSIYTKIVKFKIKVTRLTGELAIIKGNERYATITNIGEYELTKYIDTNNYLWFYCLGSDNFCSFTVEQIYIGDGSYITPIIDNANGQNNATNNGVVAVSGVSGKGGYFLKQSIKSPYNNLSNLDSWTLSFWLNLKRGTNSNIRLYAFGNVEYVFCDNFNTTGSTFIFMTYKNSTHLLQSALNLSAYIGQTIHIAVKTEINRSGTSYKTIYINGVLKARASGTIEELPVYTNGYIGGTANTSQCLENSMIDDFLIFDRALSEEEVTALYLNRANTPKFYNMNDYRIANANVEEVGGEGKYIQSIKQEGGLIVATEQSLGSNPVENGQKPLSSGALFNFFDRSASVSSWLGKVFGWMLGKKWITSVTQETHNIFKSICYGNGLWVTADGNSIYYSVDRVLFEKSSSIPCVSVHYGNGVFIACVESSIGLYRSVDGLNWEVCENSFGAYGVDAHYANGLWVACLSAGSTKRLLWSTNGGTGANDWTDASTGASSVPKCNKVYYANNLWMASADNKIILKSTDGKTWTQTNTGTAPSSTNFTDIHYGNGVWCVCANNGIYYSLDENTWSSGYHVGNLNTNSVYYANGIWVLCTENGLWWANDGVDWNEVNNTTGINFKIVRFAYGVWVAGTSSNGLWWSNDGKTWTKSTNFTTNTINDIHYADGKWCSASSEVLISDYLLLDLE